MADDLAAGADLPAASGGLRSWRTPMPWRAGSGAGDGLEMADELAAGADLPAASGGALAKPGGHLGTCALSGALGR
jgi:hypothetical protein